MTNLHYQYNDKTHSLNHGKIEKGYNAFHIHASYDLLEHTYDDIIIEGEAKYNENAAFIDISMIAFIIHDPMIKSNFYCR